MPNYPFTRAKPIGYALYENFPSAHANIIDANAAQAADGLLWTDVAAIRNWGAPQNALGAAVGSSVCYVPYDDTWWSFAVSGGAGALFGGSGIWQAGSPSPATGITPRPKSAVYDAVTQLMIIGGLPGASSNQKFRRYNVVTRAWTTQNSSQTNTNSIDCIAATPALNPTILFVAGHSGNGVVETSADGITWTSRTVPNTNPRSGIAVGPINGSNGGIVITSTASTNKLIHSVDGINWIERTLPSTQVWWNVVYVPLLGQYIAIADAIAAVASSVDGINWVSVTRTLPNSIGTLNTGANNVAVAYGRTIMIQASNSTLSFVLYSQDGGATWKYSGSWAFATGGAIAHNGYQAVHHIAGTGLIMSIAGGF